MDFAIDKSKTAIKTLCVFKGLSVDNPSHLAREFLNDKYQLIVFYREFIECGYTIFHIEDDKFIFDLYNFTQIKTRNMTEQTILNLVKPYCELHGLKTILANVERKGMGIKLKKMGFHTHDGKQYIGDVSNVF